MVYCFVYEQNKQETAVFLFFSVMSVLTTALCARLSWLLVSLQVHLKSLYIIIIITIKPKI